MRSLLTPSSLAYFLEVHPDLPRDFVAPYWRWLEEQIECGYLAKTLRLDDVFLAAMHNVARLRTMLKRSDSPEAIFSLHHAKHDVLSYWIDTLAIEVHDTAVDYPPRGRRLSAMELTDLREEVAEEFHQRGSALRDAGGGASLKTAIREVTIEILRTK